MSKKTQDQIIEKYSRGVQGAAQDYANGVQSPARPWSQATQQGAKRWASGIQQAIANNSFARGVAAAGDSKWQQAALSKGAQRYSGAAAIAAEGYAKQAARVIAAGNSAQAAVANMPDETQEQRIQRAAAAMRAISQAWAKGG